MFLANAISLHFWNFSWIVSTILFITVISLLRHVVFAESCWETITVVLVGGVGRDEG